jgi:hypothetical protein
MSAGTIGAGRGGDLRRGGRFDVVFLAGEGDRSGTIRLWKEILCRQCNAPVDITLPSWLTASVMTVPCCAAVVIVVRDEFVRSVVLLGDFGS